MAIATGVWKYCLAVWDADLARIRNRADLARTTKRADLARTISMRARLTRTRVCADLARTAKKTGKAGAQGVTIARIRGRGRAATIGIRVVLSYVEAKTRALTVR